jgi:phage terminase large subunit-like protein
VPQKHSVLTVPSREFKNAVLLGNFCHLNNPVLKWMAGNTLIEPNPSRSDGIKPEKLGPHQKIDGIVALCVAWERLLTLGPQSDDPNRSAIHFIRM